MRFPIGGSSNSMCEIKTNPKRSRLPFSLFLAAACISGLSGCGREDLGDGYQLVEEYSEAVFLAREGPGTGVPVCSHIPRAAFNKQFIVGYHQKPEPVGAKPLHKCDWEDLGYFIVTKETAELELELTEDEFLNRC